MVSDIAGHTIFGYPPKRARGAIHLFDDVGCAIAAHAAIAPTPKHALVVEDSEKV